MEKIVKQADLLVYRGEKREEYLKQEFKLLAERQERKEEAERQAREKKEEAERQAREKKEEAERRERKEEADRKERWIELFKTDKSYEKLKDLIVQEQFIDACPEDLATSLREKDLPTPERVAKEADLFLKTRNRKLCDQPRKVFQGNARPRMDSVRPLEPEKKFNEGHKCENIQSLVT
ncbi:hypothetical protein PoB_004375800 [Plakobranchus ocellatus]|uniref:Uncharacterized protein n=1 Tax=Plakobranchus ocellatus TaxID=259542 RepID=A0AAV4BDI1_9GAST|nr:hypothetical protein PoB_004375800 [Plakobranchus ocellatus]